MVSQVVLITGALSGIGRATAFAFAKEGAQIMVSGRREADGQALVNELRDASAEAEFIQADIRYESQVRDLVDGTMKRFGRIDVAVNNAGTEGDLGPMIEQTSENYTKTFETNVLGTLLSMKHELRVMQTQGHGSIINLSSIVGQVGIAGASVYVASKHAVEGLTKSAALEGAPFKVRVNAVAPGPIETKMLDRFTGGDEEAKRTFATTVPAGRTGTPEEIAQTIVFLASEHASYITGHILNIDGGYVAQ